MKQHILILSSLMILFSFNIHAQGCYYAASATYTTNGGTVAFVNTSQMFSSSYWDFGDGNSSNQHNPLHTYSAIGSYTVTLNITYHWNLGVYGSFSCNKSVSGIVTISTLSAPPTVLGCTDPTMFNYNPQANLDDGSCVPFIYGCTDPLASNYSSYYNTDDGSCLYCPTYAINEVAPGCPNNNNGSLEVVTTSGTIPQNTSFYWTEQVYIPPYGSQTNSLQFTGPIATGLGNHYYSVNITHNNGCPTEYLHHQFNPTLGCTDSLAINYDPIATCDDGSCTYLPITCDTITGIYMTDIIHDRATFNWNDMNIGSCVVDKIRIRYSDDAGTTYNTKTINGLDTSKRILNLSPATQYIYDFKIWYQDGTIENWHAGAFTTLPICNNVNNITATPLSATSTKFCWTAPNSNYSFVRLKYREDIPGSSFSNIGGMGIVFPELCKTKNGLNPETNYRAIWKTWCDPSGGPYRAAQWDGPVLWSQPSISRIEEKKGINELNIYPNPSRNIFNISFKSEDTQNINVRVVNIVGEVVYTEKLDQFVGEYNKAIELTNYTKGIYFLKITTKNRQTNTKLILQ